MALRCQIFLYANFTDQYFPLFEISYVIEIILSLFLLGVIPLLIRGVWKSMAHRNVSDNRVHNIISRSKIRIIISHIWLRYGSAIVARLILLYYQAFSIAGKDSDILFFIANFLKSSFVGYLVSFMCSIAFERLVATFMWSWYERQGPSTMIVAFISLLIIETFGAINWFLYTFYILSEQNHYTFASWLGNGTALFVAVVYWLNVRIMKDLKRGARFDHYSINRTYQILENLKIFKGLLRFAGPTMLFNMPGFISFALYLYLPQRLYTFRYFAVAFYDFNYTLYGLSYFLVMMFLRSKSTRSQRSRKRERAAVEAIIPERDIYFAQLNAQFNNFPAH